MNNIVTFEFPNEELKERFIAWMSDGGGGEQEFMNIEENLVFNYDGDTVSVTIVEDENE